MELKDVILSTLAEIDRNEPKPPQKEDIAKKSIDASKKEENIENVYKDMDHNDEMHFLKNQRERILVLFEGLQSPNNKRMEAKIDLILNFFEYLLSTLDERIENLKKS